MSNFTEKSKEMNNQSSYKISVMKSKGLLKKQLNYDNIPVSKGAQKMDASSMQLVKSKILRYPPNYEPNRYMFNQCEEGEDSFCGCLSLYGLTKYEIYVSSNQAVSRKELVKSGCFQSFN